MEPPRPLCREVRVRGQRAPSFPPGSRRCSREPFLSPHEHPARRPARPRAEEAAGSLTKCQGWISPATAWQSFAARQWSDFGSLAKPSKINQIVTTSRPPPVFWHSCRNLGLLHTWKRGKRRQQ